MAELIQFPGGVKVRSAPSTQPRSAGVIKIESTEDGDVVTVSGAYSERLQRGVFALTKAMNMFVDRIAETGQAGHTTILPVNREVVARRSLPEGLASTDFGELVG